MEKQSLRIMLRAVVILIFMAGAFAEYDLGDKMVIVDQKVTNIPVCSSFGLG